MDMKPKPKGGRASRQKGDRFERQLVRLLQDHAFGAERVPLSGSAGGSYTGDFTVPLLGRDLRVEAKARATGFATLYGWLEGRDALVVKADRKTAVGGALDGPSVGGDAGGGGYARVKVALTDVPSDPSLDIGAKRHAAHR